MFKTSGLRQIFFMILTAIVLVSLSVVLYWRHLDAVMEGEEVSTMLSASRSLAGNFEHLMDVEVNVLSTVVESLEGLPRVEDKESFMSYLARQKQRNNFEVMGFQFLDGTAYFSDGSVQKDFLSAPEISAAQKDRHYISAPLSAQGREKSFIIAKPVRRNGAEAGVLFAAQSPSFYKHALHSEAIIAYTPWLIADEGGGVVLEQAADAHDNAVSALLKSRPEEEPCKVYPLRAGDQEPGGTVKCSVANENYIVSYIPLAYNNWYLLTLRAEAAPGLELPKQLMSAVFVCVLIIIVLGLLLGYIIHVYRQHSLDLYRAGFIYHVTGLGNHNYFLANFNKTAQAFRKKGLPFALTIINIDKFKAINDIYGFEQGDKILNHAARIMEAELHEGELLCHSSSDRFLLLLACQDRAQFNARLEKILSRIKSFCGGEKLCFEVPASAGVYLADEDVPFYIMIDRANMARNSVRHDTGQIFAFYNDAFREQIRLVGEIEGKMNAALAQGQFKVFLQPKYDFKTGRIESAEALVRWQDPQKGLIPPDNFIPVFEKNGFVLKLDMYILEETVKLLARRISEGKRAAPVGVNFSRLHFEDANFINSVTEVVDRYKLPRKLIELEITESIAFAKGSGMRGVLDEIKARGFSVAMDDFGAGYSSLNILKDLYFDCVKLDKEFLSGGEDSERMRHIISGTVKMIKKLGCIIVTEGVETKEQAEFLKNIGCDLAQGYIYSRPLPIADFEKLLDEDAKKT